MEKWCVSTQNWLGFLANRAKATIGKEVVKEYYGQPAAYSYFAGCSQGGRHGYEFAQKYPDAFDGIAAAAPVISMLDTLYYIFWPQFLMNQAQSWPRSCEMDSLTALAIQQCDGKDGVKDNIISDTHVCEDFDPFAYVGEAAIACEDGDSSITEMAALIVNATWTGLPDEDGDILYPGMFPGSDLTGNTTGIGVATTTCYETEEGCMGLPIELGYAPARIFGVKDATFDYTKLTVEQLYDGLNEAKELIGEHVQTFNPDLGEFRRLGGKLLTYHGLVSHTCFPRSLQCVLTLGGYYSVRSAYLCRHCPKIL